MNKTMEKIRLTAWGHAMALMFVFLLLTLHSASGTAPFSPSPYNNYTLQALAWRGGLPYLPENVPCLELAIKYARKTIYLCLAMLCLVRRMQAV